MRLMLIDKELNSEAIEFTKQLGSSKCSVYIPNKNRWDLFEDDQKNFDCIFSTKPEYILKLKLKIPYFYNIPTAPYNYDQFHNYFSQLSGASAVFVNDKKINKYCHWMNLNSHWANVGIDPQEYPFIPKKFLMPQLHIGFMRGNGSYRLIKEMWYARKANWKLHINKKNNHSFHDFSDTRDVIFYSGNNDKEIYKNCHVILNPAFTIEETPSHIDCETLSSGCVLISPNFHGNNTHIFFDKVHYFKLDFVDKNTILETLRYVDKRREKLERMAQLGPDFIKKYFNIRDIVSNKLEIIKKEI